MLRVALTGGAGAGKSMAARMFAELGAFVSSSDEVARAMMQPNEPVFRAIAKHFGAGVLGSDGALNRRALARIAFEDGRVEELNAIVHPAVIAAQAAWMLDVGERHTDAVAMVESALVLETRHGGRSENGGSGNGGLAPWRTRFDRIVLVTAAEELRVERYVARALVADAGGDRAALERDAHARIARQMPEREKVALADFVLGNDGTSGELRDTVSAVFAMLQAEAADRSAGGM